MLASGKHLSVVRRIDCVLEVQGAAQRLIAAHATGVQGVAQRLIAAYLTSLATSAMSPLAMDQHIYEWWKYFARVFLKICVKTFLGESLIFCKTNRNL